MLYGRLGFDTVQQLLMQCGWITVGAVGNGINALVVDRLGRVKMFSRYNSSREDSCLINV